MTKNGRKKYLLFALTAALISVALMLGASLGAGAFFGASASGFATAQGSYGGNEVTEQWYFQDDALNFAAAKATVDSWDMSRFSGDPIVIAVVDTGLDKDHSVFSEVLLRNELGQALGYNSYSGAAGANVNFADTSSDRHGNGVAGIIAILIKEFKLQNYIKIYPIKANTAGKDSFSIGSVTRAIQFASSEVDADVINLSLGLPKSDMKNTDWVNDSQLKYAVGAAARTSLIVAAAGNNSKSSADSANMFYPAAMEGVYSVMNYGSNLGLYSTSNYGGAYDIAAPGQSVLTAGSAVGSQYRRMTGTSAATPIASFAAALLKVRERVENNLDLDGYDLARRMRNLNVRSAVVNDFNTKFLDFNAIVNQDFDNTVYEDEIPVGIEVTHNGELGQNEYKDSIYMRANRVKPLSFVAKVLPFGYTAPEWEEELEWVLIDSEGNEEIVGRGPKLEYNAEKFGDTTLVARLDVNSATLEDEQDIHIEYIQYLVGDVHVTYLKNADDSSRIAPNKGNLYTSETTVFTLTGLKYLKPEPVKWYVNGKYAATGNTFNFKPSKTGDYLISAQYGDEPRVDRPGVAFSAHVRSFILRPLDMTALCIAIGFVIAGVIMACVIVRRKRKARAKSE